jgi:predicted O-methyltransferase YrrM
MQPTHFLALYDAPALLAFPERVALYSTVFGRQPRRTLEIGTFQGGSSMIITAALDDVGAGELVCVDPAPQVAPAHWAQIEHRATMLTGTSPQILAQAAPVPAQRFQLALIDGDHSHAGVIADLEGVLPILDDDAIILFHDAYYHEVADALQEMLVAHADCLTDCGLISTLVTPDAYNPEINWGGLREFRFVRPDAR